MKKIVAMLVTGILVTGLFSACGATSADSAGASAASEAEEAVSEAEEAVSEAAEATAETEEAAEAAPAASEEERITVGVSYLWLGDDYMKNMQNALQTYAAEHNIELIEKSADSDGETQVKHLENFITSEVDAILYQPVTATTGMTAVQEAMDAGIPVITMNTIVEGYDDWGVGGVWASTSDARVAGMQMAELLAKLLHEEGNVAIIEGEFGSAASDDRIEGTQWILDKYENLQVVFDDTAHWARDEAYTLMSNWLATGTEINGVVAASSEEAIGAMNAIQDAGMTPGQDIIIVTTDNSEECDGYIKDGRIAGCCTHDSNFEGQVAMEFVDQIVRQGVTPAVQTRYIPHNMITLENLSQFEGTMKSFSD